jgi:hypothetical protein
MNHKATNTMETLPKLKKPQPKGHCCNLVQQQQNGQISCECGLLQPQFTGILKKGNLFKCHRALRR